MYYFGNNSVYLGNIVNTSVRLGWLNTKAQV